MRYLGGSPFLTWFYTVVAKAVNGVKAKTWKHEKGVFTFLSNTSKKIYHWL